MTKLIFDAASTWIDEIEVTGDTNQVELAVDVDEVDQTNFASDGWTELAGGLKTVELDLTGFWDEANYAGELLGWVGSRRTVATVAPTGVEGAIAYLFRPYQGNFALGAEVGQSGSMVAALRSYDSSGLVRGSVGLASQTIAGDTDGTAIQEGALSATQSMVANIHVFTAGTTLDISLESDDNSGFTSAVIQATDTLTAVGGTRLTVAGPVTDDWWRLRVDTVTGSFVMAASFGIV